MRAARFYGKQEIRIDDIPAPVFSAAEVLVAPAFCGICGSDLHEYMHGPLEYSATPHPLTGEKVPLTLGHEFSGVIVAVGTQVQSLQAGDRVVIQVGLWCGNCEPCQAGNFNVCIKSGTVGQHGRGGGLAELIACEERWCHKIPDHVGLDIAALTEPLAVAEHAFTQAHPQPDTKHHMLVLGCGPIGLAMVQILRAHGLQRILVVEISAERRKAALTFGATQAFDPKEADVVKQILHHTDGLGPHIIFECAGVRDTIQMAIDVVRVHGIIIEVAMATKSLNVSINSILYKEVTYRGTVSQKTVDWKNVIQMLANGSIKPASMITKVVPLDRVVEDGIICLAEGIEGLVKVLVEVNSPQKLRSLCK